MKFKAGKYYVGDPCYIFEKSWNQILNETNYFQPDGEFTFQGIKMAVGSTAYGDGTYYDNYKGYSYDVDAGMLSLIPIEAIKIDNRKMLHEIENSTGMNIIDFKNDFEVKIKNGIFYFGHIVIDTKNYEEETEDEDENY